ncbi:peptidase [Haloplanus pelagicus]|uniref:peptidase n=1 Tax=Haloplanus pelagicus TaxID=2949995 RepID=UPI00203DD00F|nr:peptidase [Haloplanus sp. HW8-1]
MFAVALQSTPALAPPLAILAVLVVLGVVVGAAGSAVARRLSNPVGKYRLLYVGVLLPFALLAYGVLALLSLGDAVAAAVLGGTEGVAAAVLADFAGLLGGGLVGLAAYAPTIRGVRAARGIDLSTGWALARMGRYVVGVSAVVALALGPLHLTNIASPLGLAGVLVLAVAVLFGGAPWIVAAVRSTTTPTGATRDRLDALRERAGLDVRDTLVLDTGDEETATVHVRGPPGYRRLFVTSTFLDRFDDGTAAALLAVQAGRIEGRVDLLRGVSVVAAAVPLVASVAGRGPRWVLLGAAFVALLVGFRCCRWAVRAADDDAADRVGADAVADALERYAAVHALAPTRRRVPNPLSVNVALGDRIDRLRGR